MTGSVETETRAGWRVIRLNRPDKLNAFNAAMHAEMLAALDEAAMDRGCRALLLTGAGRAFCAGQELADEVAPGADLGPVVERFNALVHRIRDLPIPVVAAVNGVAAGAGANLALACDIVLAGRGARFIQAFVKIGLAPDTGGSWFLPRLVGEARARALLLTGEAVTGAQAAEWGMVWRAVEDTELLAEAEKLAGHLATHPTATIALIKRALEAGATNTLAAQLDLERDLQRIAGATADYAEGVRAFQEKRPPRFTGGRSR